MCFNVGAVRDVDFSIFANNFYFGSFSNDNRIKQRLGPSSVYKYLCCNNIDLIRVMGNEATGFKPGLITIETCRWDSDAGPIPADVAASRPST